MPSYNARALFRRDEEAARKGERERKREKEGRRGIRDEGEGARRGLLER